VSWLIDPGALPTGRSRHIVSREQIESDAAMGRKGKLGIQNTNADISSRAARMIRAGMQFSIWRPLARSRS